MSNHTPGPWQCDQHGIVTGGPDYCTSICETYRRRWAVPEGLGAFLDQIARDDLVAQNDANGRLIAAAPTLLEACYKLQMVAEEYISEHDESGPSPADWAKEILALARDAIAKAEGREECNTHGK